MTNDVLRMRALASEIATVERKYLLLSDEVRRNPENYEEIKAAQRALGTSEAATLELADLMRAWGISVEDLAAIDIDGATITKVCEALEGWEVDRRRDDHEDPEALEGWEVD